MTLLIYIVTLLVSNDQSEMFKVDSVACQVEVKVTSTQVEVTIFMTRKNHFKK